MLQDCDAMSANFVNVKERVLALSLTPRFSEVYLRRALKINCFNSLAKIRPTEFFE